MRRTFYRLHQYLTLGQDKIPISNKVLVIQEMTNHRLLRTRPQEVTKLLNPKRSTSSMRRQFVRLLRYSTNGWDKFPISQERFSLVHEMMTRSTTTVLDRRMGQVSYLPGGFFSSMRRHPIRLLQYSIDGWDKLPISQEDYFLSSMR